MLCSKHNSCIQSYYDQIVNALIEASRETIPVNQSKSSNRPCIAGWNDHVSITKKKTLFWHQLWKSNNCPKQGFIADIRRKTRARYHQAIRLTEQNNETNKANAMARSFLKNNSQDFRSAVRKEHKKTRNIITNIDGIDNVQGNANLFAEKYDDLYNSVSYDVDDMSTLKETVENKILCSCGNNLCTSDHHISVENIASAIKHIKPGEHDGSDNVSTDHIINAPPELYRHLAILFSKMLQYGYTPKQFRLSKLIPIPKNKRKSLNDSTNYRAIALSSIFGKVLIGLYWKCIRIIFIHQTLNMVLKKVYRQ